MTHWDHVYEFYTKVAQRKNTPLEVLGESMLKIIDALRETETKISSVRTGMFTLDLAFQDTTDLLKVDGNYDGTFTVTKVSKDHKLISEDIVNEVAGVVQRVVNMSS